MCTQGTLRTENCRLRMVRMPGLASSGVTPVQAKYIGLFYGEEILQALTG